MPLYHGGSGALTSDEEFGADVYITNAMWFIFITMTTVGYGDISPDTNVGRFFSVLACFVLPHPQP